MLRYAYYLTIPRIFDFFRRKCWKFPKILVPLHPLLAQMAESVDALVSNTSGATRAGSTPALGTKQSVSSSGLSGCSAVGSALRSGRRGRAFESPHPDKIQANYLTSQTVSLL